MSQYIFSYLYDNKYTKELLLETQKDRNVLNDVSVTVVENGCILPGNTNVDIGCGMFWKIIPIAK